MKLVKFLFAVLVAGAVVTGGYYMFWHFSSNKNVAALKKMLEDSSYVNFKYRGLEVSGYPRDINIKAKGFGFMSENNLTKVTLDVGDVLFDIYPFVLEQQANITLPVNQIIKLNNGGKELKYKLNSEKVDFRLIKDSVYLELKNVTLYDFSKDEDLFKAEKIYYTGFLNDSKKIKLNIKNLDLNSGEIFDTIDLDLELSSLENLDMLSTLILMLSLEKADRQAYYHKAIEYMANKESNIKINSIKVISEKGWFDFTSDLKLDQRKRIEGTVDIISDKLVTAENILKFLISNERVSLGDIDIVKRMLQQDSKKDSIRIEGNVYKGFLYIFNERTVRAKPFSLEQQ